ncbi:hypothetical protein KR067_006783, partial [Drosophila pandora]
MESILVGMKYLVLCITVLAYVGANPPLLIEEDCGRSVKKNRGFGGKDATEGANPWMAMVLVAKPLGFICGGSLITKCLPRFSAGFNKTYYSIVRLGEYNRDINDDNAIDYDVIKSFTHNHFHNVSHVNDIAMMLLERPVQYTDNIRPICVILDPELRKTVDDASILRAVGWGETGPQGKTSRVLQTFNMKRSENQICALKYNRTLSRSQICVSGAVPNTSICNGDSGGPVGDEIQITLGRGLPKFVQIGIASYHDHICDNTIVLTDVLSHGDWIYKVAL